MGISWVGVTSIDILLLSIECDDGLGCVALLVPIGLGTGLFGVVFGLTLPVGQQ